MVLLAEVWGKSINIFMDSILPADDVAPRVWLNALPNLIQVNKRCGRHNLYGKRCQNPHGRVTG